jgi:hypothetical protein
VNRLSGTVSRTPSACPNHARASWSADPPTPCRRLPEVAHGLVRYPPRAQQGELLDLLARRSDRSGPSAELFEPTASGASATARWRSRRREQPGPRDLADPIVAKSSWLPPPGTPGGGLSPRPPPPRRARPAR